MVTPRVLKQMPSPLRGGEDYWPLLAHQRLRRLARYHELFGRFRHDHGGARAILFDARRRMIIQHHIVIADRVEGETEEIQPLADTCAHGGEFSPIPPVKTSASIPPMMAA